MNRLPEASWLFEMEDEQGMERLAADIAALLHPRDLVTLSGDLGSGKTRFARAIIRILAQDPGLDVPSPTFTLMQAYDGSKGPIIHADFYRLKSGDELVELGWDEATDDALVLVEWAERARDGHGHDKLAKDRLDIAFYIDPARAPTYRRVVLTGAGSMAARVARARAVAGLLQAAGWSEAAREFMLGDASTRAYERLTRADGARAILMISPPRPDGPPVRYGKPYSAIARLAENISPFIALAEGLRMQGLSAPVVYAHDLVTGLALIEDLGHEFVIEDGEPVPERYGAALEVLAHLHQASLADHLPVTEEVSWRIPPYDLDALMIEVELVVDWYVPHIARIQLSSSARAVFLGHWQRVLAEIVSAKPTWTLRDYHSPNLLWLPQRQGIERVGVIDFQDCVMGHPAYDVTSLLQDARVSVPDEMEMRLLGYYASLRRRQQSGFDTEAFARAYAILAAQRATKILGIFARLDKRDRKPQYLAHLPRIEHYLAKSLRHPVLEPIRQWYGEYLPAVLERGA